MFSCRHLFLLRKKPIKTIPKEFDKFYNYSLKTVMAVDSKEGLRVRKETSLNS